MRELLVIVPTRGRPHNVPRILDAWEKTGATEMAQLLLAVDADDPTVRRYDVFDVNGWRALLKHPQHLPMVVKLNDSARYALAERDWPYIAFMGDDHVPKTVGWAQRYVNELKVLGTGVVYGDDLVQGEKLCTQWAMTTDIVRALGRMVPADVEHMYCDNSVMDLAREAGCLKYLADVRIEHAHPVAGRGAWDAGYERVNSRDQYRRDHASYMRWREERMSDDVTAVKALIEERVSA